MGLSPKSNYRKKKFLVLTLGKFLEALGSEIGTCSVFCHSFSLSNNVWIRSSLNALVTPGMPEPRGGGQGGSQIVADQITLCISTKGVDYTTHITPHPFRFSYPPASLDLMHLIKNGNIPSLCVPQPLHKELKYNLRFYIQWTKCPVLFKLVTRL